MRNKPSPSLLRNATSPERGRFFASIGKAAISSPFGGKTSPGRGKMSRKRQKGVMASECETERAFAKITKKYLEKLEEKSKMYPTQVGKTVL